VRPPQGILLARDGYERYIDGKLEPADRLAAQLIPGVEEAWDFTDDVEPLLEIRRDGRRTRGWLEMDD
jgi:hypothetical protein